MEYLSVNNKRVKLLKRYYESSKHRQNDNIYVIEGKKLLREADRADIKEIYISEDIAQNENIEESYKGIPIYVLQNDVFKKTVRTDTPQGVAAVLSRKKTPAEQFFDTQKTHKIIICEHLQDPGNMGTIIRTALAAGFDAMIVDSACVDVYNPKCVSASMSGLYRLPILAVDSLVDTIFKLKSNGYFCIATAMNGKFSHNSFTYPENMAIIIGNEGRGISKAVMDICDTTLYIPMNNSMESLNAAVAASIVMYETLRPLKED